jgi:uncharacterized protein
MTVGTLEMTLIIRGCHSLKEKRRVLNSIKDTVRARFNVSVAEVDAQDMHQKAVLGIAAVGTDGRFVNSVLTNVGNFVGGCPYAELAGNIMEIYESEN